MVESLTKFHLLLLLLRSEEIAERVSVRFLFTRTQLYHSRLQQLLMASAALRYQRSVTLLTSSFAPGIRIVGRSDKL